MKSDLKPMTLPRILMASLLMFSLPACAQSTAPAPAKKPLGIASLDLDVSENPQRR